MWFRPGVGKCDTGIYFEGELRELVSALDVGDMGTSKEKNAE